MRTFVVRVVLKVVGGVIVVVLSVVPVDRIAPMVDSHTSVSPSVCQDLYHDPHADLPVERDPRTFKLPFTATIVASGLAQSGVAAQSGEFIYDPRFFV